MDEDSEMSLPFDQRIADTYPGKYILVGITYVDRNGNEVRRVQLHGVIKRATPDGITVSLRGEHNGESWNMPPDLRAITTAGIGVYTLHSTGERVENPDLLASWTIHEPPSKH